MTAALSELLCEYSMSIPVHATLCKTAQCPPAMENIARNNNGYPVARNILF